MRREKQPKRTFGADDVLICPECGANMHLSRRGPHAEHGKGHERQTFTCARCDYTIERNADEGGLPKVDR